MSAAHPARAGRSRPVVMVDVARHAGVSQKTVSRVVNDAPHVRPDVRERVSRAIEELGYRPNPAAQALARERTHTIGVLTLGTPLHGPSRRVFSLEHEVRRLGWTMALSSVPDLSPGSVAAGLDTLLDREVEGLVLEVPTHLVEIDVAQLGELPVVTSAGQIPGVRRQAVVDIDQAGLCAAMTDHLLGLGHETVWHLAGPRDWDASQKRLTGWRAALRRAGRRVPSVRYGDWSAASGYRQGRQLADRADVTAVLAANDQMAMGLLRAFFEAGRPVPDDVAIAGFDDVPEAEFQVVPLSTVSIDADRISGRILDELMAMIEGADPPTDEVVVPAGELVLRASSGAGSRPTPPTPTARPAPTPA